MFFYLLFSVIHRRMFAKSLLEKHLVEHPENSSWSKNETGKTSFEKM